MVVPVIEQERAQHRSARCREQFAATCHESPRRHRGFVTQAPKVGLLGARHECRKQFLVTADGRRSTCRRSTIKLIARDEFREMSRHCRHMQRQYAQEPVSSFEADSNLAGRPNPSLSLDSDVQVSTVELRVAGDPSLRCRRGRA
jgi:2-polyprenyl-6-methoxyphenol hydroxylase-like FAD-dependent oxidoreductase